MKEALKETRHELALSQETCASNESSNGIELQPTHSYQHS
jgi:hypothetical protein